MAERRMFAKTIIDSDAFLEMPQSTQLLYFHLNMRADDDGFINNPKSIMRTVGSKDDDLSLLILKKFIIPFESGIVVIKHWKIHNYIAKDRYHETRYKDEKSMLESDENNAYRLIENENKISCIQNVDTVLDLDKNRLELDKNNIKEDKPKATRFVPPTIEQINEYGSESGYAIDSERFIDYYSSKGWLVGKSKMKDWKASVRNWNRNNKQYLPHKNNRVEEITDYTQTQPMMSEEELIDLENSLKNIR